MFRKIQKISILLSILISGVIFANPVDAALVVSKTTGGNWSSTGTWLKGVVPTETDQVRIAGEVVMDKNLRLSYLEITKSGSFVSNSSHQLELVGTGINSGFLGGLEGNGLDFKLDGVFKNYAKVSNTSLSSSGFIQNSGEFNLVDLKLANKTEFKGTPKFNNINLNGQELVLNSTRLEAKNFVGTATVTGTGGIIRSSGGSIDADISGNLSLLEIFTGSTSFSGSFEVDKTVVFSGANFNINKAWNYPAAATIFGNLEIRDGGKVNGATESENGLILWGNMVNYGDISNSTCDTVCKTVNLHLAIKGNITNYFSGEINGVNTDIEGNIANYGKLDNLTFNSLTGAITNSASGSITNLEVLSYGNKITNAGYWAGGQIKILSSGIKTFSISKLIESNVSLVVDDIEFKGSPRFSNLDFNGKTLALYSTRLEVTNLFGTASIVGTGGILRASGFGGTFNTTLSGTLSLLEFNPGITNVFGSYESTRTVLYSGAIINLSDKRQYSETGGVIGSTKFFGNLDAREGSIIQSKLDGEIGLYVEGAFTNNSKISRPYWCDRTCHNPNIHIAIKGNVTNYATGQISGIPTDIDGNLTNYGKFEGLNLNMFANIGSGAITNTVSGNIINSTLNTNGQKIVNAGNWSGGEIRLNTAGIKSFSMTKMIQSNIVLNSDNIEFKGTPKFINVAFNSKSLILNNTRLEVTNLSGTATILGAGGIIRASGGGNFNANLTGSLATLEFSNGVTNVIGSYDTPKIIIYSGATLLPVQPRKYSDQDGITSAVKFNGDVEVKENGTIKSGAPGECGILINGKFVNNGGIYNNTTWWTRRSGRAWSNIHLAVKGNIFNNASGSINSTIVDTNGIYNNIGSTSSSTIRILNDNGINNGDTIINNGNIRGSNLYIYKNNYINKSLINSSNLYIYENKSLINAESGSLSSSNFYLSSIITNNGNINSSNFSTSGSTIINSGEWNAGEITLNTTGIKTFNLLNDKRLNSQITLNADNIELKGDLRFGGINFNSKNLTIQNNNLEVGNTYGTGNINGSLTQIKATGGNFNANIYGNIPSIDFISGDTSIYGSYDTPKIIIYSGATLLPVQPRKYSDQDGITSAVKFNGDVEVKENGTIKSGAPGECGILINGKFVNNGGIYNNTTWWTRRSGRAWSNIHLAVKGNIFNNASGSINSTIVDTQGNVFNYGNWAASSKINLYGGDKSLSGDKALTGPIECKSHMNVFTFVPNNETINLINCVDNNLGYVGIKIPGGGGFVSGVGAMYCSVNNQNGCVKDTSKEELYLDQAKDIAVTSNLESSQDAADPVNIVTGEFTYDNKLLHLPGRGMSVDFDVTYKSQYKYNGPLGYNFDHNYNLYLVDNGDSVDYYNGRLSKIAFTKNNDGTYAYQKSLGANLEKLGDGTFVIKYSDGRKEFFGNNNKVARIEDKNGNRIEFSYYGSNLTSIKDTLDKVTNLYYSGDKLIQIVDPKGKKIQFDYYGDSEQDGLNGDLKNITLVHTASDTADKKIHFTFATGTASIPESYHNIAKLYDTNNNLYVENFYNSDDKVISQKYGNGEVKYEYSKLIPDDYEGVVSFNTPFLKTRVTNRNGIVTTYIYNNELKTLSRTVLNKTQDSETVFRFEYDNDGNLSKEVYPKGNGKIYKYDSKGNLIDSRSKANLNFADNDNEDLISKSTYDPTFNKLTQLIKPDGTVINFILDDRGNTIEIKTNGVKLDGNTEATSEIVVKNEYDDYGQLLQTTDAEDNVTKFEYENGLLVKTIKFAKDRGGVLGFFEDASKDIIETYKYDDYGSMIEKTDSEGNKSTMTYNEFGSLVSSMTAEGIEKKYTYDNNDNILSEKIEAGNLNNPGNRYVYNILDLPTTSITQVDNNLTNTFTKKYDANDNLIEENSEINTKFVYQYDEFDRLTKKETWANDQVNGVRNGLYKVQSTVQYFYDKNGNLVKSIDPLGAEAIVEYDSFDRVIKTTDPIGNYTVFTYNKAGNIIETSTYTKDLQLVSKKKSTFNSIGKILKSEIFLIDTAGNIQGNPIVSTFKYNLAGNLIETTDDKGNKTYVTYDEFGRVTETTDALGNKDRNVYNKRGLVITNYKIKTVNNTEETVLTTKYKYDKDGRLIENGLLTIENGEEKINNKTSYVYNKLNQVIEKTDGNDNKTTLAYNYLGKVTSETVYSSGVAITTKFDYNKFNVITALTDAKNNLTRYDYTALGQVLREIYPDSKSTLYQYDPAGNITKKIDPNGNIITNTYDKIGRLTERNITNSNGTKGVTKEVYTYDSFGRLIKGTNYIDGQVASETSFNYNSLNQVVSETNNGKTVTYSYDTLSNNTEITYPSSKKINRTFDEINRVKSITANSANIASYDYDGLSLSKLTYTNTISVNYTYDQLLRLKDLNNRKNDGTDIFSRTYTYDNVDNILSNGKDNYSYNSIYELTSVNYGDNLGSETFGYDKMGNRTDSTDKNGTKTYNTNILNQYSSVQDGSGTTNLVYDSNGNVIENIKYKFKYDYLNRLIEVIEKEHQEEISYGTGTQEEQSGTGTQEETSTGVSLTQTGSTEFGSTSETGSIEGTGTIVDSGSLTESSTIIPETDTGVTNPEVENTGSLAETGLANTGVENLPIIIDSGSTSETGAIISETNTGVENPPAPETNFNSAPTSQTLTIPERTIAKYSYDILGRRISKTVTNYQTQLNIDNNPVFTTSATTTNYTYAGQQAIEEQTVNRDKDNNITKDETREYVYGAMGIDDVVAMIKGADIYYYHKDNIGNIVAITDNNGNIVENYRYDITGKAYILKDSTRQDFSGSTVGNTRLYTGREYDTETDLYFYRARYYDPNIGRFISRDPIGTSDQINLYTYVGNNSVRFTDPMGLFMGEQTLGLIGDTIEERINNVAANPRVMGTLKMAGGTLQAAGGMALTAGGAGACSTIVGCSAGVPLASYGATQMAGGIGLAGDGLAQMVMGEETTLGADFMENFNISGKAIGIGVNYSMNAIGVKSCTTKSIVNLGAQITLDIIINRKLSKVNGVFKIGQGVEKSVIKEADKVLGGGYKNVRAANIGGEVHHMPAASASPIPRNKGPSILMTKEDHFKTASHGRNSGYRDHISKQRQLINEGNMKGAIDMDINDIRSKFGNKYDEGIGQMLDYFNINFN